MLKDINPWWFVATLTLAYFLGYVIHVVILELKINRQIRKNREKEKE